MLFREYDEYCTNYNSNRKGPFRAVRVIFNYESSLEDRKILDDIIKRGIELSKQVNKGAANSTTFRRSNSRLMINAVAGLLAEWSWLRFLNDNGVESSSTPFTEAKEQIDLKINKSGKTIEVRSSFPRNGISFAICHPKFQFGVIGPYSNGYKIGEIRKDFYVTTLFPFDVLGFFEKIKSDNFKFFLVGGATYDMMMEKGIEKDLIPEGQLVIGESSKYMIIPYSSSCDAYGILDKMKNS